LEGENVLRNEVTINIVNNENSWTVVQRKKKNKKKRDSGDKKWNKQQKENFVCFGDIWYQEPYKEYQEAETSTPVANVPQPQQQLQQHPVLQQQPAQQPQQPLHLLQPPIVLPPQPPALQPLQPTLLPPPVVPQNPPPQIIITPPLPGRTLEVQKSPQDHSRRRRAI
jgi:hypothetical protein